MSYESRDSQFTKKTNVPLPQYDGALFDETSELAGIITPERFLYKSTSKIPKQQYPDKGIKERMVGAMSDQAFVAKGEFDAHIRRLEDAARSMEDRIVSKLDHIVSEMTIRDEARTKEVDRLLNTVEKSIESTKSENKYTRWTMLGLTFTILAGVISAMVPIGWQILQGVLK